MCRRAYADPTCLPPSHLFHPFLQRRCSRNLKLDTMHSLPLTGSSRYFPPRSPFLANQQTGDEIIDMETFQQIMDMDEEDEVDEDSDEKHSFSKGIVWGYFTQAEETFKEMEDALCVFLTSLNQLITTGTATDACCLVSFLLNHPYTNTTHPSHTAPMKTSPNSPPSATFSKARPPRLVSSKSKPLVKRCSTMAIVATKKPAPTSIVPRLSSGLRRYWSSARRTTRPLRTGWSRCTMISSERGGLEQ